VNTTAAPSEPLEVDPDGKLLRLQKRFLRAFAWLRRSAGLTQRELAQEAGWKQPYVARLEDERSPLIMAMARIERYALACGATGVMIFVDKQSGEVRRSLALGDDGVEMARAVRDLRFETRASETESAELHGQDKRVIVQATQFEPADAQALAVQQHFERS